MVNFIQLLFRQLYFLATALVLVSPVPYPYRQRMPVPVVHEDCDMYDILLYGPGPDESSYGVKYTTSPTPAPYWYRPDDRDRGYQRPPPPHPNDYNRRPPLREKHNIYNYPVDANCCDRQQQEPQHQRPEDRSVGYGPYNYYNYRRTHQEPRPSQAPYYPPMVPTSAPEPKTPAYDPFATNKNYRPTHVPSTVAPSYPRPSDVTVTSQVSLPGSITVTTSTKDRGQTLFDTESSTQSITPTTTMEPIVDNPTTTSAPSHEPIRENPANFIHVTGLHSVHSPTPVADDPPKSKWPGFSRACESYFECDFRPPGGNYSTLSAEASATTWFLCDGKFCICELFGGARDDGAGWRVKWSKKTNQCMSEIDGPCGYSDGLNIYCEPGYQCINSICDKPGRKRPKPPSKDDGNKNGTDCEGKLNIFSLLFFPNAVVNAIVNHSMNAVKDM